MAEPNQDSGAHDGEVRIGQSTEHRRRAAISAGATVGTVLVPVGVVLTLLSQDWSVLALCVFATALVAVGSYFGQAHNEVFVGPRGIRRVSRDCDLTATWPSLRSLDVNVPGNRIVKFTLETDGLVVERLTKGHSNAAEALVRNPPEGFNFQLERSAADALIAKISERRRDLKGIADWSRSSRPS
jgi:hypothetical protein